MSTDTNPQPPSQPSQPPAERPPGLGGLMQRLPLPLRVGLPLAVVAVIAVVIVVIQRGNSTESSSGEAAFGSLDERAPTKGETAPDFVLQSLDGSTVRLSDLRGKPVVLNFWATWCGPCRDEMPALQEAYAEANGAFELLAINSEGTATDLARRLSVDFRDELSLTFPVLLDSPGTDVFNQYRLHGLPDTFFIDREGIVRDVVVGPLSRRALEDKLSDLLSR